VKMKYCFWVASFLLLIGTCSCAPNVNIEKRFFWPPFVDNPKIEYGDFFQSDYDVKKRHTNSFEEYVFGREIPRGLFLQPYDLYSDGKGRLFVTESVEGFVYALDLNTGTIGYLKDSKGEVQPFGSPLGICGDVDGNVFVVDSIKRTIFKFNKDQKLTNRWELGGVKRPVDLAVDVSLGVVYVVSADDHQVFVLSLETGEVLGSFGGRGSEEGEFNFPLSIDVDNEGNVYVLDSLNARVQVFDNKGNFLRQFGERGTALGSFQMPKSLSVGPDGIVYVTDSLAHKLVLFDLDGNYLLTIGSKYPVEKGLVSPGGFYLPQGVNADDNSQIWVVDALNKIVHRFQYVTREYLEQNPILPGQVVLPNLE